MLVDAGFEHQRYRLVTTCRAPAVPLFNTMAAPRSQGQFLKVGGIPMVGASSSASRWARRGGFQESLLAICPCFSSHSPARKAARARQ